MRQYIYPKPVNDDLLLPRLFDKTKSD